MIFNVVTANLSHETNTFVQTETTKANFEQHCYMTNPDEIIAKHDSAKTAIGSTLEIGREYGWNVVPAMIATANPSGRVNDKTFDDMVDHIISSARGLQKVDGVILHLHGAMVCVSHEDAEGELLRRLRDVIGNDVPVFVTLDLHGNISQKMVTLSNCLIAVRTYPHIDFYERGIQAAHLLQSCMTGKMKLYTAWCKVPAIGGCDGGRTQKGPMVELLRRGDDIEQSNQAVVVSICAGFTAADIYDIGPSVTVTVNLLEDGMDDSSSGGVERAQHIADSLGEYIWQTKEYSSLDILTIEEAVDLAVSTEDAVAETEAPSSGGALVLADVSDNPGSGHHGDSTALLQALLDANLRHPVAFFAIYDPDAVLQGEAIGVGNRGVVTMGGRHAPHLGGAPIAVEGVVAFLGDSPEYSPANPDILRGPMAEHVAPSGRCMRFVANGNIDICVISNNGQSFDIGQLTALGCNPYICKTIALKSKHHFRAHFESISRQVATVDGGGLGSVLIKGGKDLYTHTRRPIWPIDDDISYP